MSDPQFIVRVALDVPLRTLFDYRPVSGVSRASHLPGCRIRVPFGRRDLIGVIVELADQSTLPLGNLKAAHALLDTSPVLTAPVLQLCRWSADYYQHALGEVCLQALPTLLRQDTNPQATRTRYWHLTAAADVYQLPPRAYRQKALAHQIAAHPEGIAEADLRAEGFTLEQLKKLAALGMIECQERESEPTRHQLPESPLALNAAQQACLDQLISAPTGHHPFLLYGVTGSGKTEVYLQWIASLLQQGRQVLVLIPEISLTPQTFRRFQRRFGAVVGAYHSGLTELERWRAWDAAQRGRLKILIGTRSAIFAGFQSLGAIIVDEEHDPSFKQQDGFRYSARDLAMVRGKHENVPVLLGSATPSLESLRNANLGKYRMLQLEGRAGGARLARVELLDIKSRPLQAGLSRPLLDRIGAHLGRGEQVLVFINRRGFAPVLMCHDCDWFAECPRCDARMTLHRSAPHLRCHHCDSATARPARCPKCSGLALLPIGTGTERTEDELQNSFPNTPVHRIDSDTTRSKSRFTQTLEQIREGHPCILVGTQILAKGHHFPNVTLVAVVNADSGLFSSDFRATERMVQTLVQVGGRAGREEAAGSVMIQTHHADHDLLRSIANRDYLWIAQQLLTEREQAELPPYSSLTLLQTDAKTLTLALQWLAERRTEAQQLLTGMGINTVRLVGPLPALMERRADRYRAQLQISSAQRGHLKHLLAHWLPVIERQRAPAGLRWSIDVDPIDLL